MTQRYAIGIDLGGTSVKYALVSEDGNILTHGKHPSLATESGEAVIGQILKGVKEAKTYAETQGYNVTGIGVGTPGIIDDTYPSCLEERKTSKDGKEYTWLTCWKHKPDCPHG